MRNTDSANGPWQADRPEVLKTGGWVVFAGLWFFLLGSGLTTLCVAFVVLAGNEMPFILSVGLLIFAALPLAAAALGVLLMFGGERITLDPRAREVTVEYGRLWTWRRDTKPLDSFQAVELCQETSTRVGRENEGSRSFPIRLLAPGDEIELAAPMFERRARELAERIANLTGLPLQETTARGTALREAGTLDESVADRARRLGDEVTWPRPPKKRAPDITTSGDEVTIDLPRPDRKMVTEGVVGLVFLLALYGGGLGWLAYNIRGQLHDWAGPDAHFWPALAAAVPLIPVAYILVFGVVLLIARERVIVSPRVFQRVWLLPVGRYTRRIPADEIEQLAAETDDVTVRTDRTKCRVGFTLDKRGRRWLKDAIRYVLVKGAPPVSRR